MKGDLELASIGFSVSWSTTHSHLWRGWGDHPGMSTTSRPHRRSLASSTIVMSSRLWRRPSYIWPDWSEARTHRSCDVGWPSRPHWLWTVDWWLLNWLNWSRLTGARRHLVARLIGAWIDHSRWACWSRHICRGWRTNHMAAWWWL